MLVTRNVLDFSGSSSPAAATVSHVSCDVQLVHQEPWNSKQACLPHLGHQQDFVFSSPKADWAMLLRLGQMWGWQNLLCLTLAHASLSRHSWSKTPSNLLHRLRVANCASLLSCLCQCNRNCLCQLEAIVCFLFSKETEDISYMVLGTLNESRYLIPVISFINICQGVTATVASTSAN